MQDFAFGWKKTDPELEEIMRRFLEQSASDSYFLDDKTKYSALLAALIALQARNEYSTAVLRSLDCGIAPVEIKEILYQAVAYVGVGTVSDFLALTNEIFRSRGIQLPLEAQAATSADTRSERGLAVQKSIFGDTIDRMYETTPKDQIHIQRDLSANCFGDYYTRTELDIRTRELLTFSILLSLGCCEPQLKGHIQGNINVGNGREILIHTATWLLPYVGYPRTLNALQCIDEITLKEKK